MRWITYAYNVYYVKSRIGLGIEDPVTRLAAVRQPKRHVTDHIGFLAFGTLQPSEYGYRKLTQLLAIASNRQAAGDLTD